MLNNRDDQPQGKLGHFAFQGQHAFKGGFSSCVANTMYALAEFSHMSDEEFFKKFSPPSELSLEEIQNSCDLLSNLTLEGNKLSIKDSSTKGADKIKGENKIEQNKNFIKQLYKSLKGREFKRLLQKIQISMEGYENVKDLVIMAEKDKCPKNNLIAFFNETYERLQQLGLQKNDIMFLSGAAFHETALFARIRPVDGKIFYYVYDTAPSRVIGGDKNIGIMEIHDSLESTTHSLILRWKMNRFIDHQEGDIYAVTHNTRINQIKEQHAMEIKENQLGARIDDKKVQRPFCK